MSPIAGFTRFRKHQIGKQTVIGSAVAATRVMPYRGAIIVNPNRTDPDVDVGSLDPVLTPFQTAREVSANWAGLAAFDDLPYLWALTGKGGVTPTGGGTAKTWDFQLASLTADDFEYITDEWGDDTSADDGVQAYGGVINQLGLSFDEGLGPFAVSADLLYAGANLAVDRTGSLSVDNAGVWVFGADTELFVDTTPGGIGGTKWTDAVHGVALTVNNNLDQKRFANGSNTRFQLSGYGRGERTIELALTLAKTAATMAEAETLDDDPVPNRYIKLLTISTSLAEAGIPYSQAVYLPMRLFSRADGEIGGNTTMTLTYRGFYDSTLTYALRAVAVCKLAAL